ncbi:hypothetical protein [Tissierella sp.]|uniref:hypothetical protein n=1 Tax=Tissierella sp. TaxID=41274 RepID=UPI0028A99985|nr:hypothetical protein [Tissierella sp.]
MAIRSGFFNSINGDRRYDASRFAEYFSTFIGNGVFPNPSTGLQVVSNNDMTVTVKAGKAWIDGYILINDDDYILNIDVADGVLNRIDRVVLRYDVVGREIRIEIKKGTFASSPVAPSLQRDADVYELGIADIRINRGAVSITQANITDLRLSTGLCGIVHGTVDQVDTTTLFNQYKNWYEQITGQAEIDMEEMKQQFEQEFLIWFDGIKNILDENAAANLLNMINVTDNNLNGLQGDLNGHKNNANNPHKVTKSQIELGNVQNYGIATKEEAEEGTSNSKYMTPLRAVDTLPVGSLFAYSSGYVNENEVRVVSIPLGKKPHKYIRISGMGDGMYAEPYQLFVGVVNRKGFFSKFGHSSEEHIIANSEEFNLNTSINLIGSYSFGSSGGTNSFNIRRVEVAGEMLKVSYLNTYSNGYFNIPTCVVEVS